ncbi:MAG TPA: glycosyltransferase family 4 protein [Baekduia sp.]
MKIALITVRYASHAGALDRHVRELARGLSRRGEAVEVIVQECERRGRREPELDGGVVRRFPLSDHHARFTVTPALSDHLRRTASSFDVVHVHGAHLRLAVAAVRAHPRRVVFSPLVPTARLLSWPHGRAARGVVGCAAQTICTSEADADLLRRAAPEAADRVVVVPQGVDAAAIQAAAPFSTQSTVVLIVGRLERRKRVERAIAAMASLSPAFELVVVGGGPAGPRLMGHAVDLQVFSRVSFTGPISDADLHRWLSTAHVVACLSEQEAFGLAMLEGIAADAPVVVSDIPPHREAGGYVGDLGVGFVSPEGSPFEVADAISDAVTFPAPVLVRPLPSWADVVDRTLAVYQEVLGRPPADATRAGGRGRWRPLVRHGRRDVAVEG